MVSIRRSPSWALTAAAKLHSCERAQMTSRARRSARRRSRSGRSRTARRTTPLARSKSLNLGDVHDRFTSSSRSSATPMQRGLSTGEPAPFVSGTASSTSGSVIAPRPLDHVTPPRRGHRLERRHPCQVVCVATAHRTPLGRIIYDRPTPPNCLRQIAGGGVWSRQVGGWWWHARRCVHRVDDTRRGARWASSRSTGPRRATRSRTPPTTSCAGRSSRRPPAASSSPVTDPAFCSGDDVKQIMVAAGSETAARLAAAAAAHARRGCAARNRRARDRSRQRRRRRLGDGTGADGRHPHRVRPRPVR